MRLIRAGLWTAGIACGIAVCRQGVGQLAQVTNQRVSGSSYAVAQTSLDSASSGAQSKPASASSADRYVAEPTVIERNDREITFAVDGTGSEHQTLVVRVQTEAAVKSLSVVSFAYASFSQNVQIDYVRVRHADGSVVDTPTADALEMPTEIMRQAPFYSDLKQKQIPVRGLRAGDRLEWSVRLIRTVAEAPGRFWGNAAFTGKEAVALAETFTLRLPKSVPATVWSPKQPAKVTEEGTEQVYRWTSSQSDPTGGPEAEARTDAEKKRILRPEEIADRTDGALPLIAWTNFPDWPSVGAWYRALEGNRVTPDEVIRAKATQLISGKTTDEARIRALYGYTATEIRYIGVALGQGRYQPHLASEVLANQYGDCKDKATLLTALLSAAGYSADTVLIGAGIRFNEAVPSPAAFNHAITAISLGSNAAQQTIWLDSTQEVAPYRALLFGLRDKQALRIPLQGSAHLDRTPANLPFDSFQKFQATGTLDASGVARGKLSFTYRGDDEIAMRTAVRQVSPSQYNQLAQYLLGVMGYGGTVSHGTFTPPERTEEPMVMSFEYERDKPGNDWGNYRIVTLDGPDELPVVSEKETPQVPLNLGTPRTLTSRSELVLPAGWDATPPDNLHQHTPWVKYDRVYRVDDGTLIEERTITILQSKIPVASWPEYKKFASVVSPGTYPYVQLTRGSASEDSAGSPQAKDNPEARRLISEAAEANQRHQIDRAGELIEQAKEKNSEQPFLWSVTGFRAMLQGNVTEAVTDYARELELHPNEGTIYALMAAAQMAAGKRLEAELTLRRRPKNIGPDSGVAIRLVEMLLEDGNSKDAVGIAEDAVKADFANQRLRWMLGRARMKAGQKAAGGATLFAALRETDDPGLRNDIAYELADADLATQEVEDASRKSVKQLTVESANWTLSTADQDIREMRTRSNLLVSSWDTLGWTIYKSRTGHEPARLEEAKRYVTSAWQNILEQDVGLHLGELEESQHHFAEALVIYQLARATAPDFDIRGLRRAPTEIQRDLTARIDRLKKTNPQAFVRVPMQKLKNELKLDAGPSHGRSIVAPYRLLLAAGGVESAVPIESSDGDHGKADISKDLDRFRRAIPASWVPHGSVAHVLRSAVLNCHQEICEVMVTPLSATR